MADEKMEVISNKKRLFIKRERIRRALMHVKPDVVYCIEQEDAQLLLDWLKELEKGVQMCGSTKGNLQGNV